MDPLTELVGLSPAISAVREDVRRVLGTQPLARRPAPLLLQGETGTGKGLLARACHQASHRAGPFVSINCAAIPESLMEAELFGYARGAFTGAVTAKAGLFQSARGGTIFLDEIGLIGDALQTKLLSVVDERTVRRLGSTLTEPVDVWIMAATSLDLEDAARTGGFRQDLYHRLAVLPIRLPPLRERGGDILLLAEEFLARACRDHGLPFKLLTADARTALLEYRWPGNVRELANVMERATLLCVPDEIDAAALALRRPPSGNPSPATSRETVQAAAVDNVHVATPDYRASLDQVERVRLREALTRTGWNVARAAEQLGIPRNSLRYRLARLALGPDEPRRRRGGAPAPVATPPELRTDPRREPGAPARQRAVSFLRVGAAGARAAETRWISSEGLDLIAEKIGTFGGRIIRRDTMHIDAAFGLDPAEDAPGRAGNAALAIRTLVARARAEYPAVRVVSALETVTCLVEERQGESHIDESSLHDIERALSALTSDAAADGIVVGPGAAPHLERQFALAPGSVGHDEHELTSLVGRGRATRVVPGPRRSPFAGRSQEVSFLRERLRQVAETGRGHIVGLMGEPGIGKSRLLAEFTATLTRERIALVEGRCASHGTTTPYALLLDIVRRAWRLDDLDTPDALVAEISRRVSALDGTDENTPVVLSLFDLRAEALDIGPEGVKARAFAVLSGLLLAQTRSGPLVLVIEDLHWADQTSQEFLAGLADSLTGSPMLVVATMRPGYRAPWLDRSWASQLALPPLSLDNCLAIVHALRPELHDRSAETMARRAGGNPSVLEELSGAAAADADRPASPLDQIDLPHGWLDSRIQ